MMKVYQSSIRKLSIFLARVKGIPKNISLDERILRILFHPMNIKKTGNLIKPNSFKSPSGIDEVSTNRLDFTTFEFCKMHAKRIQNPTEKRTYFGFAVLKNKEIIKAKAIVEFSPKLFRYLNLTHSDIKIGHIRPVPVNGIGEELPSEFTLIIDELASNAKLYTDPNINSIEWLGDQLN